MKIIKTGRDFARISFLMLLVSATRSAYAQKVGKSSFVFPKAPTHIRLETVDGKHAFFNIKIEQRKDSPPPVSYWQPDQIENVLGLHGILASIPLVTLEDKPRSQPYFVFRDFGVSSMDSKSAVASYHITPPIERVYDPQFSIDGKTLFFKTGWPFESHGSYRLFKWDFEKGSLKLLLIGLANQFVYPSPDGKWLAYIRGGDTDGLVYEKDPHLVLHIMSLQSEKDAFTKQDLKPYGISWTSLGTLLFTMPASNHTMDAPPIPDKPGKYDWTKQPRPAIYEALPSKAHSSKLIDSGEYPVPSPDGNRIAYFGWSDKMEDVSESTLKAESKGDRPPHRVLSIFDRKTSKSKLAMDTQPYSMLWSHDGNRLIVLKVTGDTEGNTSYNSTGDIMIIDIATMKSKEMAILHAKDYSFANRTLRDPAFNLTQITKDGRYLLVKKSEYIGSSAGLPFFHERKAFLAIDLTTGTVRTFAQIDNDALRVIGWDWHDMSTPSS